ncbi:hypothetical protein [Bacteroides fragilis]|uniref:hypothetical protein n=1 Tax=Bacteroides fragilis TaxID=817 RepID=UPI0022E0E2EB|nr:hypothetical protein [Bacteroides fragilis]
MKVSINQVKINRVGINTAQVRGIRLGSASKGGQTSPFHPSLVDYWNFKGKSNFDKDRNIIKGVKGNIFNAYNFGWSLGSGYGKYTMNYLNYLNNSKSPEDIIITDSSITRLKGEGKISFWVTGNKLPTGITVIPSYRINVTGEWETPPEFTYYDGDNASISHTITLTHGINIIPEITINVITSISSTIYGFSTFQNGDVTIEQIPEYEGAIVTDGVDDYLKLDKVGYKIGTIIIKHKPIRLFNGWQYVLETSTIRTYMVYNFTDENINTNFDKYNTVGDYGVGIINTPRLIETPLYIGCQSKIKEFLSMALYDIAIYQDVLTAEEIQKEINVMEYGTPNPVFALNFDNFAYKAVDYPEFATGKVTTKKIVIDSTTTQMNGFIVAAYNPELTTGDAIELPSYKVKVTGIDAYGNLGDGYWAVALMGMPINASQDPWVYLFYKDGIYDIPAISLSESIYNLAVMCQIMVDKPIEIEILYDKNITKSFPETKQIFP